MNVKSVSFMAVLSTPAITRCLCRCRLSMQPSRCAQCGNKRNTLYYYNFLFAGTLEHFVGSFIFSHCPSCYILHPNVHVARLQSYLHFYTSPSH